MTDIKQVVRRKDEANKLWAFKWEREPVVVAGGAEERVLRDQHVFSFEAELRLVGFWTFHGLDRGDIVEMDTNLTSVTGIPLFFRGPHKEEVDAFNAWEWFPLAFTYVAKALDISILCRVNGENETLPKDAINVHRGGNRLTARPHWGIWMLARDI